MKVIKRKPSMADELRESFPPLAPPDAAMLGVLGRLPESDADATSVGDVEGDGAQPETPASDTATSETLST